jgi:hypothetical protein
MRKRRWLLPGCLAFWLLVSGFVGFVFVVRENSRGTGSMTFAVKVRPGVEAMPEPERTFADNDTGRLGIRFTNGGWVTGVGMSSHGFFCDFNGGGTVVLKDSRGRVRCFFGHVCGNCNLMRANEATSLDEFDSFLTPHFTEQRWP